MEGARASPKSRGACSRRLIRWHRRRAAAPPPPWSAGGPTWWAAAPGRPKRRWQRAARAAASRPPSLGRLPGERAVMGWWACCDGSVRGAGAERLGADGCAPHAAWQRMAGAQQGTWAEEHGGRAPEPGWASSTSGVSYSRTWPCREGKQVGRALRIVCARGMPPAACMRVQHLRPLAAGCPQPPGTPLAAPRAARQTHRRQAG